MLILVVLIKQDIQKQIQHRQVLQILILQQEVFLKRKHLMSRSKSQSLVTIKRVWAKVIEPITNYKRKESGYDYALDFFYQFQKMIEKGYQLKVNIPLTLTGAHDNFLQTVFKNQSDEVGEVKLNPSFSKIKFEFHIEKSLKQSLGALRNKKIMEEFQGEQEEFINNRSLLLPYVVLKQKIYHDNTYFNLTSVLNSYQYKRITAIDANQLVQAYIFTKNMKASVIRFFYSPKTTKSVAYRIENTMSFLEKKRPKDFWKVQEKNEQSCDLTKIMYENKSFYTQTEHVVKMIEKYFQKEINYIVTDWIIDPSNKYYLVDVKQVDMVPAKPKFRISKSLTELLSTVTCSMCLQTCNQSQISKILTNKLIINFYHHLRRRGVTLSFRINFKKIANFSRVCDLCYNLVVAETKLIETEKKMSQICNFQTKIYGNTLATTQKKDKQISPKMHQWRLFFYLEQIKDLFSILPQADKNAKNIYLNLQVNDSTTCFDIKLPFMNTMAIKMIKVEHIFSETLDIKQFLRQAEVKVQIFLKSKSSKPLAEGCTHGVYDQTQESQDQTFLQRKYKQILLFNERSSYCILGLYVGFCNDGLKNTEQLDLKKSLGVFKPQSSLLNCLSLPAEWMEIVYQDYRQTVETFNTDDATSKTKQSGKENEENSTKRSKSLQKSRTIRTMTQQSSEANRSIRLFPQIGSKAEIKTEKRGRLVL